MSTTPADLRAAAEHTKRFGISGFATIENVNAICDHILATVHADDDERVTVEKLVAMGGAKVDHNPRWQKGMVEFCNDEQRIKLVVQVAVDDHITAAIVDRIGTNVYVIDRYEVTRGQLRHLLAGLQMGG